MRHERVGALLGSEDAGIISGRRSMDAMVDLGVEVLSERVGSVAAPSR